MKVGHESPEGTLRREAIHLRWTASRLFSVKQVSHTLLDANLSAATCLISYRIMHQVLLKFLPYVRHKMLISIWGSSLS